MIRIGLFGAIGLPNLGDEAILQKNIDLYEKIYGSEVELYIFSKDASYTSLKTADKKCKIYSVDFIHQISKSCFYNAIDARAVFSKFFDGTRGDTEEEKKISYYINNVFTKLDALHIIGGGYISEKWPDASIELWGITRLALKYKIKYFITGISIDQLSEFEEPFILDVLNDAEFVDLRADLDNDLKRHVTSSVQITCDDAILMDYSISTNKSEKYVNVLFHPWIGYNEILKKKLHEIVCPFLLKCIRQDGFHINILSFSPGDFSVWENIKWDKEVKKRIHFIDCLELGVKETQSLLANAFLNLGSRFHMAVFSLASGVPMLSIVYDSYYLNKTRSIHELYLSEGFLPLEMLSYDHLASFLEGRNNVSQDVSGKINENYRRKLQKILSTLEFNPIEKTIVDLTFTGPKISVIIPIYNMEAYLADCLDSLVNQSLRDIEIICIDDGSTDSSLSILNQYAWSDNRIVVITKKNEGVARARNDGINIARGEYLFFLDPDDWVADNDVFRDLYNEAINKKVDVCGGNFIEYSRNGVINTWVGVNSKYSFGETKMYNYAEFQFDYGWVRFIYNRRFLLRNNCWIPELKFFEDPVFFVDVMSKAKKFYGMNRAVYCYRSGHHAYDLTYEKVLNLIEGITENIRKAKLLGYEQLFKLQVYRLINDYSWQIIKYLRDENNIKLMEKMNTLNNLIYNGTGRIENKIVDAVIKHYDYMLWRRSRLDFIIYDKYKLKIKNILKRWMPRIVIDWLRSKRGR